MNIPLNDSSTVNNQPWPRHRHLAGIPIHWRYGAFETIKIRQQTGVVAQIALIAKTKKIFASKSDRRIHGDALKGTLC